MPQYETHPKSHGGDTRHYCRRAVILVHRNRIYVDVSLCRNKDVNNHSNALSMKATHITHDCNTNRKLANRVLKALDDLTECDNGTIRRPFESASICLRDGRTLIETLYEDGELRYNDGYLIVEADNYTIYVDYSSRAAKEYELPEYGYITNIG